MTDLRRNWIVIGSIALLAMVVGIALTYSSPRQGSTSASPKPSAAAITQDAATTQPELTPIKDYGEFSGVEEGGPSSDWLGLLAGMAVKLAFVLVLIFLAVKMLRRYVYHGQTPEANKRPVSLIGTLNLAPNRSVYVLEVGRKMLVVGASQTQLSLLTEVTDQEAIEELRGRAEDVSKSAPFSALLGLAQRQRQTDDSSSGSPIMMDTLQSKIQEGHEFMESQLAALRRARERS
ncbi:MAG: flagellar biosynthetic protein FliO [Chloroflexi bacterium]|nr:flagellar biosynthetic protein FliO [Chloroflexota bacterium]